jgi:hypothetical protein
LRLSDGVLLSVKKAGVEVYFVDRRITKMWNKDRGDDPTFFGGWYWNRKVRGKIVETDKEGPFRSSMAAYRDAYAKLQLRSFG